MAAIGINILLLAVFCWLGVNFWRGYAAAQGTRWQRILAASKSSATIAWAQLVILATALINSAAFLSDFLSAGAGEQIKTMIPAEYVAAFVVFTMAVSILARLRSLGS